MTTPVSGKNGYVTWTKLAMVMVALLAIFVTGAVAFTQISASREHALWKGHKEQNDKIDSAITEVSRSILAQAAALIAHNDKKGHDVMQEALGNALKGQERNGKEIAQVKAYVAEVRSIVAATQMELQEVAHTVKDIQKVVERQQ